jgi:S-adenosylmethionine:tRNA ribosyltransferase-isomerase
MKIEALDYELPEELIAQHPTAARDAARLLVPSLAGTAMHRSIRDLPALLTPGLIVWNDARVIPARLRGERPSGGKAELLLLEPDADAAAGAGAAETWLALGRANKPLQVGRGCAGSGRAVAPADAGGCAARRGAGAPRGGQLRVRLNPSRMRA